MNAPKHRPLRFQYTLRVLFIFTTLVAIVASLLGAKYRQVLQQRETAVAVTAGGGRLMYDWQWEYVPLPGALRIPRGPRWLRSALGDDYFDDVVYVDIRGPQADDALAARLRGFPRLRFASLADGPLTDAGLEPISQLPHLEVLNLDRTRVTDAGLRRVVGLTELKSLSLEDTQLSDDVLVEFAALRQLEKLNVNGTRVTREGVALLRRALPRCEIFLLNPFPATKL